MSVWREVYKRLAGRGPGRGPGGLLLLLALLTALPSAVAAQATTVFLSDTGSSVSAGSDDNRRLNRPRGSTVVTYTKNTATGLPAEPSSERQITRAAAGTAVIWYSDPLDAVTISGNVTFNIWARESHQQANAGLTAELLRTGPDGAIISVIAAVHTPANEIPTALAAQNWTRTPAPTALANGDRLALRSYITDYGTMGASRFVEVTLDGPTANVSGDSWFRTAEALAPARPSTGSITGLAQAGFTANWSLVEGTTGYTLAVSVNPGASPSPIAASVNTGEASAQLSGLSPNTTYYAFVRSHGPGASSSWAAWPVLVTPAYAPSFTEFTQLSSWTARFNWSANGNHAATLYHVAMSTASDPLSPFGAPVTSSFTYNTYLSSSGLLANRAYNFRVAALNHAGAYTSYTSIISTYTLAARPMAGPFSGVSGSGITASWTAGGNPSGTLYRLLVSTAVNPASPGGAAVSQHETTGLSFSTSGLAYNTTYYFMASAVNGGGVPGDYFPAVSTATLAAAPVFSSLGNATFSSLDFAWTGVGNPAGTLYRVVSSTAPDPLSPDGAAAASSNTYSVALSSAGLSADTRYYFRAAAVNHNGVVTAYTGTENRATRLRYDPASPAFGAVSETAIGFSFADGGNAPGTLFRVFSSTADPVSPGGAAVVSSDTYNFGLNSAGLTPNVTYYFRAAGVNKDGVLTGYTELRGTSTLAALPSGLNFTETTLDRVRLDWGGGNAPGTLYTVRVSTAADPLAPDGAAVTSSGTYNLYLSTEGLAHSTEYSFRVRAVNNNGVLTDWTGVVSTTTLAPGTLAAPLAGTLVPHVSSMTAGWSLVDNATGYTLAASLYPDNPPTDIAASSAVASQTAAQVPGLAPDTVYYLFLRAGGPDMASAWSSYPPAATLLPSAPAFGSFSGVGEGAVSLSWSGGDNPAGSLYRVASSTAVDPLSPGGAAAVSSDTYNLSLSSSGLRANTTYYFRITGVNKDGVLTAWTTVRGTSTLAAQPVFSGFSGTGTSAMTFAWTAAGNPAGTLYRVRSSRAPDPLDPGGEPAASSDTYNLSLSTAGLAPNTSYYFRVAAVNNNGLRTEWSDILVNASLPEDAAFPGFGTVTDSSIDFMWSGGNNPGDTLYRVLVSPAPDPLNPGPEPVTSSDTYNLYLSSAGLAVDKDYYFVVAALRRDGQPRTWTSPERAHTLSRQPVFSHFNGVGPSSTTVNWTANGNPPGTLYRVAVSPAPDPLSPDGAAVTLLDSYALSVSSAGLAADTTYYFRVAAVNGDGVLTAYTAARGTATLVAYPPLFQEFSDIQTDSIRMIWSANGNGDGTLYRLAVSTAMDPLSPGGAAVTYGETYELSLASSGLVTNTLYYFRAAAVNKNGVTTAWTAAQSQATLQTSTKLYLRDEVSPANPDAGEERLLAWRRGAAAVTYTKNTPGTVTPPTAASQFTKVGAGAVQTWYTPPLDAVTIVSSVTFNIWAMEDAIQANAGLTAELLRANAAGTVQSVIASVHVPAYELGLTMQAWSWTREPVQTALSLGDRLALRLHLDDAGGTMAGNRQAFASVGGPTAGAVGDSWVQILEDIRPARPASGSVTGVTAAQMSASWSLVGETTGYTLASSLNPGAEPLPVYSSSQTLGNLSATLAVPALSANTTYYLFVRSNMPGASSGWQTYAGTATLLAYNPAPAGFGPVASAEIRFDWSHNGNPAGTRYRVVSSTAPDPLSPDGAAAAVAFTYDTYLSSAGLAADTTYFFRVAGVNHNNVPTAYTAPAGTATLLGYPPAFSSFSGVTETAMQFNWSHNGNSPGTLYRVVSSTAPDPLAPLGAVTVSSLTYNTHLSTAGLAVNTTYYFRVAGVNKNGVATAYTAPAGTATLAYTPVFGSFTGAAPSAIALGWTAGGNPAGTLFRVLSSTADPADPDGALVASSDTYNLSLSSAGLAADTTYYFRVAALNRGGVPSAYTAAAGTATLLAFPPAFDLFSDVTAAAMRFGFSANGNAAGTLYRVVSSTATDPLAPDGAVAVSSYTYNLYLSSAGLPADTTHYFSVAGVNRNGVETAYTAARGTATLLAFPPASAGFGAVTEGEIRFDWNHNGNADGTLYRVLSSTAPDPRAPDGAVVLSSETYNLSLASSSLRADTVYYFRVAGVNKNGVETDWTTETGTSTPANVPSGLNSTGVTEDFIQLNWSASGNRTPGTLYRVRVSTAPDPLSPGGAVVTSSDTYNLNLSTPGLTPSTAYYFRAAAINNNGVRTDWSDPPFSAATLSPGSIGSPATGEIADVHVSSLAATWSLVDGATGYTLAASLYPDNPPVTIAVSSDTLGESGTQAYVHEPALAADTVYYLFARANKEWVSGDWFAFPARATLLAYPPSFVSFSGVAADTAQFNFDANLNAFPGTKFRVLTSTAPDPLAPGAAAFSSSDTYNVALATAGLSADTTYYFRAAGVNKDGVLTAYTAVQATATPANIPVFSGFTGAGAAELTFNWSRNGNRNPGTLYRVLASTAPDPLNPGGAMFTSSETYNLYLTTAGLAADTTYYFRAAALGVSGLVTAYSAPAGTATLAAYPPVFTGFSGVGTGAIQANWSANGNRDPGTRYRVLASTAPDPLSPGGAVVSSSDTYNLYLSSAGLTPNATRYFAIAAVNQNGVLTAYTAAAGTATLAAMPLTAVSTFSAVTSGGFTAAWNPNANPAGTVYQVQVSTAQNFNAGAHGQTASTVPAAGYSYGFGGLLSNRDYYFRVRVLNHNGVYSAHAVLGSTRTLGLSAPSVLPITQVSTFSITASWSLVEGATGYTLAASVNSGVPPDPVYASSVTAGTSAAVFSPALALNTTYYLFVKAGGPGDESPWAVYPATSTLANTPTAPGSPFGNITDNGFTLSWGGNSNPLSVTWYTVQISTASNFNAGVTNQVVLTTAPAAGPGATFSGLTSDTYYYARVRAHHNSGNFTDWVGLGNAKTLILAEPHAAGDGVLFYGQSGNSTPQFRDYGSAANSFSAVRQTIAGAAGKLFVIRTSPLTTKQEAVAAYVSNGTLRVLCTDGANWYEEWSQSVGGTDATRRFDVAFETKSGDVMVLYSRAVSGANELGYRTKPGSAACGSANWSSAQTLDPVRTSGVVHWVKMAPDRRADYDNIAAIWADSASGLSAMVWNGLAWENEPAAALETSLEIVSASQDVESFAVETESLSGDIMVVWGHSAGNDGTNGVRYITAGWTGGSPAHSWGTVTAAPTFLDDATNLDLAANPASDEMVFASIGNAGSDLQAGYWSGAAWTNTANLDTTSATPAAGTKLVTAAWISSGTATRSVIAYNDATATNVGWYVGNGGTFTAQTDFNPTPAFANPQRYYDLKQDPVNRDRLMLTVADSNADLFAKRLVITAAAAFTWSNADGGTALETNLGSALSGGYSYVFWPAPPTTTFEASAYRFFANADSTDVGSPLAALDALAVLPSAGAAFRLRTLLTIGQVDLPVSGQSFKLQFAGQGDGTCAAPSNGTPASYTDVDGTTLIAYNDNPAPADKAALTANAADPAYGAQANINQVYAESGGFSNTAAGIARNRSGMWDLSLKDNGMAPGAVYCLRVVKDDGLPLEYYTAYPRVVSPAAVVLNEVYPSGASASADWVELYNNSGSTAPLAGWKLEYVENTIALGGSANTVWTGQSGQYINASSTFLITGLALDLNGAQSYHVRLLDAAGGLVDRVQWPAGLQPGQSFARISDGHQAYFEIDPTPTRGYANSVSTDALVINEVAYGALETEFVELYNSNPAATRELGGYALRNAAASASGKVFRFSRKIYPEDFTALDGSSADDGAQTYASVFGAAGLSAGGDFLALENSTGSTVSRVTWQSGAAYTAYNYAAQLVAYANPAPAGAEHSIVRGPADGSHTGLDSADFSASTGTTLASRNNNAGTAALNYLYDPDPSSSPRYLSRFFPLGLEIGEDSTGGRGNNLVLTRRGGAADPGSPHIYRLDDIGFSLAAGLGAQTTAQYGLAFPDQDGNSLVDGALYRLVLNSDTGAASAPQVVIASVTYDASVHSVSVSTSGYAALINNDTRTGALGINLSNNSPAGFNGVEISTVSFSLFDEDLVKLDTAQAAALFDAVALVGDSTSTGLSGIYEPAIDVATAAWVAMGDISLDANGLSTLTVPTAGLGASFVAAGSTRTFFLVFVTTQNASSKTPSTFRVRLDPAGARLRDASGLLGQDFAAGAQLETASFTVIAPALPPPDTAWPYVTESSAPITAVISFYENYGSLLPQARGYVASTDGTLVAVSTTGVRLWSFATSPQTPLAVNPSEPKVEGSDVYIYVAGENGDVYKLRDDGNAAGQVWKASLGARPTSVLETAARLYIPTVDNKVRCLNRSNGQPCEGWTFSSALTGAPAGTPAVDERATVATVWIGLEDGKLISLKTGDGTANTVFTTDGPVVSSPFFDAYVASPDNALYIASTDGTLYAVNSGNMTPMSNWTDFPTNSSIRTSPFVWPLGGTKYVFFGADNGRLYKLNAGTGDPEWYFQAGAAIRSSPLLVPAGYMAGLNEPYVYFGCDDGKIYGVDANTGQLRTGWPVATGGPVRADPVADSDAKTISVGSNDGRIYTLYVGP